jgi:branched-chain amino acid transport system ATP-binding protein
MLTIARALMGSPGLLLLDELTEGLAPIVAKSLEDQIPRLKAEGMSILLSEQNVRSALKLVDRVYVIDNGRIRFSGSVPELEANEEVKKQYLMV